jgi:hypothetical protein
MNEPRLIIGIPTHGRAERCHTAIASALWQQEPARVIVSDDSDNDDIERMIHTNYANHRLVSHVRSDANTLWGNWRNAAKLAVAGGAELFSWLQDDDVLRPSFSRRVVRAFDQFRGALIYCAALKNAYNNLLGVGWSGNCGPKLAQDFLFDNPMTFDGKLLAPIGYSDAWAMAPAKAFRVGPVFEEMLDILPDGCDLLTEVLDVAFMGQHGRAIADPVMAGYWMFHDANESAMRNRQKKSKEEVPIAWAFLDSIMDTFLDWRDVLNGWINFMGTTDILEMYVKALEEHPGVSPYADTIREMYAEILEIRKAKSEELMAVV